MFKNKTNILCAIAIVVVIILGFLLFYFSPYKEKEEKVGTDDLFSVAEISSDEDTIIDSKDDNVQSDNEDVQIEQDSDFHYPTDEEKQLTEDEIKDILSEYEGFAGIYTEDEYEEEALKYPIHIYRCSSLVGNSEFEDMSILEWTMLMNDDWRHQVPFFHEYMGINDDVFMCYWKQNEYDNHVYVYDYYYTTNESNVIDYENGVFGSDVIMRNWGWVKVKFEEYNGAKISFHLVREEGSSNEDFKDVWIEY